MLDGNNMKFDKPIMDLIRARHSTRTYSGGEIPPDKMQQLNAACDSMNKAPFGEAARFQVVEKPVSKDNPVDLGDYGLQKNARYFIIGAIKKSPTALEGYGHLVEQLVLKATELGLGTCWMGLFNREYFSDFRSEPDELVPAICNVGVPAESPRLGEKVMRSAIGANKRKDWKVLFFLGNFETALTKEEAGPYKEPLEMLRLSPSSGNTQPWRIVKDKGSNIFHFCLNKVKKSYYNAGMHNLDVGICMCHFELTARALGLDGGGELVKDPIASLPKDIEYRVSWIGK